MEWMNNEDFSWHSLPYVCITDCVKLLFVRKNLYGINLKCLNK